MIERFTLEPCRWFAMQRIHDDGPGYYSPIYVTKLEPLKTGVSKLSMNFWNGNYPEGVQDFEWTVTVLLRTRGFMLVRVDKHDDAALFRPVDFEWLQDHFPDFVHQQPPHRDRDEPVDVYLTRTVGGPATADDQ